MKPRTLASESDVNSATDRTDSWRIIHQTDSTHGLCLFERLNKRADSYKSFVRECIMHVVALYLCIENEAHMNHLLMNRTTLVALLHVFVCCPQGLLITWIHCHYFTVHSLFISSHLRLQSFKIAKKNTFPWREIELLCCCHSNFDPIKFFVLMNRFKKTDLSVLLGLLYRIIMLWCISFLTNNFTGL